MTAYGDATLFMCKENKNAHQYQPKKIVITITNTRIFLSLRERCNPEYTFSEFDQLIAPFYIALALEDITAFNFVRDPLIEVQRMSLWQEDAQSAVEFTQKRWLKVFMKSNVGIILFPQVL